MLVLSIAVRKILMAAKTSRLLWLRNANSSWGNHFYQLNFKEKFGMEYYFSFLCSVPISPGETIGMIVFIFSVEMGFSLGLLIIDDYLLTILEGKTVSRQSVLNSVPSLKITGSTTLSAYRRRNCYLRFSQHILK